MSSFEWVAISLDPHGDLYTPTEEDLKAQRNLVWLTLFKTAISEVFPFSLRTTNCQSLMHARYYMPPKAPPRVPTIPPHQHGPLLPSSGLAPNSPPFSFLGSSAMCYVLILHFDRSPQNPATRTPEWSACVETRCCTGPRNRYRCLL